MTRREEGRGREGDGEGERGRENHIYIAGQETGIDLNTVPWTLLLLTRLSALALLYKNKCTCMPQIIYTIVNLSHLPHPR